MAFSTRRGRPRAGIPANADLGTPELIMKRLHGTTAEAVDICLQRGIIDNAQHWCAIHLRWLYTLRFGAPGVRALNPSHTGGHETIGDNPDWRQEREREYAEALMLLNSLGARELVVALAVYNQRPGFLHAPSRFSAAPGQQARLARAEREIALLREALDALCQLWGKKRGS